MNLHEAREKIAAKLEELSAPIKAAGLKVEARVIYADRTLQEYSEFNERCILVYGDIAIGTEELERDEFCNFSMCCEVKTALVDEIELEKETNALDGEIAAFMEKLEKSGKTATALITEINKKQEEDAEAAAIELSKELTKARIKLLIGIGAVVIIMLAVIIGIPLLT